MSSNNISLHFLEEHPIDAARTLEQFAPEDLAAYLENIPTDTAASVLKYIVPTMATECLKNMSLEKSSPIIVQMGVERASLLLRRMKSGLRVQLIRTMSPVFANMTRLVLRYPEGTVGHVMNPNVFTVHEDMTVEEVIKVIKSSSELSHNEIFITGDKQQLLGIVDIRYLITENDQKPMSKIMQPAGECLPARSSLASVINLAEWNKRENLPVVDHFGVFIGVLRRSVIHDYQSGRHTSHEHVEFAGTALAVAELFWDACINLLAPDYENEKKGQEDE